ncbi:hypothetical protein JCM16358_15030 [Halanaerocella petrolearia]
MKVSHKLLSVILVLSLFLLVGCSKLQSKPKKKENKIPLSFVNVGLTIEQTIDSMERFYSKKRDKEEKEKFKEQKQQQEDAKHKDKENKNKVEDKKNNVEFSKWKGIEGQIDELHRKWNRYEGESTLAAKKLHKVEQELNSLTEVTKSKELLSSLWQANEFSLNLARLYEMYDAKVGAKKKIVAYTRRIIYASWLGISKEKQLSDVEKLKDLIPKLKVKSKNKKDIKELKKAVEDLEQAIKQEAKTVIEVKGKLVTTKIKEFKE